MLAEAVTHLQQLVGLQDGSLVFTGPKLAPLRRSNFTAVWRRATTPANLTGFHFHDLRHTGNDLAGASGATLRELMDRMGHSTTRAALIYRHRTIERDRAIAATIGQLAETELSQRRRASGT